ncbi:hypothetical protein XELAEV_18001282mg [Xenopus laevis]|uniref:Uncharacterized protein n=1 Tax=Xenopus laevis TaxID=8355 RepID=A0A974BP70_XENLA|nr:hypothetical protein XELAEV_18001282mg [Xenopus laevis]
MKCEHSYHIYGHIMKHKDINSLKRYKSPVSSVINRFLYKTKKKSATKFIPIIVGNQTTVHSKQLCIMCIYSSHTLSFTVTRRVV